MVGGRPTHRGWLQEGVIRGSMLGKTILPTDEELGKKDDDHKPGGPSHIPAWGAINTPFRWRRRRIALAIVGLYLLYLLAKTTLGLSIFQPGEGLYSARPILPLMNSDSYDDKEPTGPPPGITLPKDEPPPQTFAGQIKFYRLAASLHAASYTHGYAATNRNILIAFASLKSAATLVPLICEMSKWNRAWVHVAIMGREDIPLDDLLEINGIDKEKCPAIWHDARPDYSEYSTDQRAESSVAAALGHFDRFLHPQAAIIDDSLEEDGFFVRGLRSKAKQLSIPIIEMPKDQMHNLMWLARLDAGSLRNWHKPTVEILVQAPSESSGGILRLLRSLKEADYSGMRPPHLTIELPADIDPSLKQHLENFAWPPKHHDDPQIPSQITIRRRIISHRVTQEESAIRFLELFYPSNTRHSHVLLLSPRTQLSPLYFHYLKYALLEYRYSAYGEADAINLMGVSLVTPSVQLDGQSKLMLPKTEDMHDERYQKLFPETRSTQFLWEAPDSHAALFFGDKWAEWHSFLSNRIKKQHQGAKKAPRSKLVSETLPAWTEYMLEFMRTRGYTLLYPATSSTESLVTIHNELYHAPEEFQPPSKLRETIPEATPNLDEPFLRADDPAPVPKNPEPPVVPGSRPLHLALPFDGDLPEVPHLPYILYNGISMDPLNSSKFALEYADAFRKTVGECPVYEKKHRKVERGSTNDLFCFGDEDEDDWEDDEEALPQYPAEDVDEFGFPTAVATVSNQATSAATSSYPEVTET